MAASTQRFFPLVVGPGCGVAGWLLLRTSSGQPTNASFWFAVLVSFGLGTILGFAVSRGIRGAFLLGVRAAAEVADRECLTVA